MNLLEFSKIIRETNHSIQFIINSRAFYDFCNRFLKRKKNIMYEADVEDERTEIKQIPNHN